MVLSISEGKLALQHRISAHTITSPTSLALDSQENLWAVGGCVDQLPFVSGIVQSPIISNVRPQQSLQMFYPYWQLVEW